MQDHPPLLVPMEIAPPPPTIRKEKVPITILTGFLGAGKSTLLRRILTENHSLKIAVLLNEIGDDVGIERRLFEQEKISGMKDTTTTQTTENTALDDTWLQVENGCLCCTAKTECILAIETLLKRTKTPLDHIIIECSGAVDPSRMLEQLWMDDELELGISLDGVICVIDCSTAIDSLSSPAFSLTMARQIASSDMLLLNRFDDNNNNSKSNKTLEDVLRNINPIAKISYDNPCPIGDLFSLNEYRAASTVGDRRPLESLLDSLFVSGGGGIGGSKINTNHISPIRAFTVALPPLSSLRAFECFLFTLIWEGEVENVDPGLQKIAALGDKECILRIKGVVRIEGDNGGEYGIQVVRELYDITKLNHSSSSPGRSALIFIGLMSERMEQLIRRSLNDLCI